MPNLLHLVQAVPLLIDNISKVMNKKEETKQKEIEETTERRKAELESSDKTSSQKTEVAIESMKTTGEVANKAIDSANSTSAQTIEVFNGSMMSAKELNNNLKEQYAKSVEIEGNRHKAEVEAVYYKTREETLTEISKKILTYAESVNYINKKIKKLELEIDSKKKIIEPDKTNLEALKQDLRIEESKYQDLTNEFTALIASIEKLIYEYKDSMEEKEYKKNLKREKRELQKYIDKIENIEFKLLNREKEKLIIDKKLQPKLHEIENLEFSLEYLKYEKVNNESNLSNIQTNNLIQGSSEPDIIDAEIEDDKKY